MKLGTGNKKYQFKFKYLNTGRTTIKNVYADNEAEAIKTFNEEYKGYEIELIAIMAIERSDT